jgi:hypothetical protein
MSLVVGWVDFNAMREIVQSLGASCPLPCILTRKTTASRDGSFLSLRSAPWLVTRSTSYLCLMNSLDPDRLPDGKTLFSRQVISIGKHRVIYWHIPFYSELHTSSEVRGWIIDLASRLDEGSIVESMQLLTKVGPEVS